MAKKKTLKQKYNDYMFNHLKLKNTLTLIVELLAIIISAFIFAYGFRSFIAPAVGRHLASGGSSGISQIILQIIELCKGSPLSPQVRDNIVSILFFVINIPVMIVAWVGISHRFALFSMLNVACVSLFIAFIPDSWANLFAGLGEDLISRALFAGICTGISSSLAYAVDGSTGGMDVISYYFALKKGTSVGKYLFAINGTIITIFTCLAAIRDDNAAIILVNTIVYVFTSTTVIDRLNRRNKKIQIQITTSNENLSHVLVTTLPHACTVADAKGGYSGKDLKIIYLVCSSVEVKQVLDIIHKVDEQAFINISEISQVYGKFYVKPIK